jgi:hypothetical protein
MSQPKAVTFVFNICLLNNKTSFKLQSNLNDVLLFFKKMKKT